MTLIQTLFRRLSSQQVVGAGAKSPVVLPPELLKAVSGGNASPRSGW